MKKMNLKVNAVAVLFAGALFVPAAMASPVPVATWNFNNTLAASESGVTALTAIDPLGANSFMTDSVFGVSQTVYRFDGNRLPPSQQAGLLVNTTGLLNNDNAYSVDMVFQFESDDSTWENIFGVSNRQSDSAFYVEPDNHLQVYPAGSGPNLFTFGEYHRVSLTNDGSGHVTSYLDGVYQFDLATTVMDFSSYSAENPDRLIHFFADNLVGGGQGEFADGRVAIIRLYDRELSPTEIAAIPEPETYAMLLTGLGLMSFIAHRRKNI